MVSGEWLGAGGAGEEEEDEESESEEEEEGDGGGDEWDGGRGGGAKVEELGIFRHYCSLLFRVPDENAVRARGGRGPWGSPAGSVNGAVQRC